MNSSLTHTTASVYPYSDLEFANYPLEFPLGLSLRSEHDEPVFGQAFEDFSSEIEYLEHQGKSAECMLIPGDIDLQRQHQFPQAAPFNIGSFITSFSTTTGLDGINDPPSVSTSSKIDFDPLYLPTPPSTATGLAIVRKPSSVPPSPKKPEKIRKKYRKRKQPTEEERARKRVRFLEKNKVAAAKCRAKKKGVANQLQEEIREAQVANTVLRTQQASLLSEVKGLKELVSLCNARCNYCIPAKEELGLA